MFVLVLLNFKFSIHKFDGFGNDEYGVMMKLIIEMIMIDNDFR